MGECLRVGLVGSGYFGRFHALKAKRHPLENFIGIFDLDAARAFHVAQEVGVSVFDSYESLLNAVDAVIIATPASTHYGLAKQALACSKHILLEKPLAVTEAQGKDLIFRARDARKIFQIGHILTFSLPPAEVRQHISTPVHMTMRRCVPFTHRGADVSVILDLMVHDLEFLCALMGEAGTCVKAEGRKVKTDFMDEASASFLFPGGCQAELFASRVSCADERYMKIAGETACLEANFLQQDLLFSKNIHISEHADAQIKLPWAKKDLLFLEHDMFVRSCLHGSLDHSSLETAFQALYMAREVEKAFEM